MTYVLTKNRYTALSIEHITRFSIVKTVSFGHTGGGGSADIYELRAHQAGPQQPFVLEVYSDEGEACAAMAAVLHAIDSPVYDSGYNMKPMIVAPQPQRAE
jgi:hypothetical protein